MQFSFPQNWGLVILKHWSILGSLGVLVKNADFLILTPDLVNQNVCRWS